MILEVTSFYLYVLMEKSLRGGEVCVLDVCTQSMSTAAARLAQAGCLLLQVHTRG